MIKDRLEWTSEKRKTTSCNYMVLNAIQCSVDGRLFGLIAIIESAKKAWDILQVIFEGSRCSKHKKARLIKTIKQHHSQTETKIDKEQEDQDQNYQLRTLVTIIAKTTEAGQRQDVRKAVPTDPETRLNPVLVSQDA